MFTLAGKTALVTGGGQGIGLAIARALAAQGARVAVFEIDADRARQAAAECGPAAGAWAVDVSERASFEAAVADVLAQWGRLDILVNNAAIVSTRSFAELTDAEWDRVLAVNLRSVFIGCQAVLPAMRAQGGGRIINLSSIAGRRGGGLFGTAAYAAAKAGVLGLTRTLARELAPLGITVNALAPGPIATPMTAALTPEAAARVQASIPLGHFGRPEDIAAGVVYLASDEAAFVTGATLDINGGLLME